MRIFVFIGLVIFLSSCSSLNPFNNGPKAGKYSVLRLPPAYQLSYGSPMQLPAFGRSSYFKPENFILSYRPVAHLKPAMEEGRASWYGSDFHARSTANGERYDMHELTAAHPTLPFGTKVWVENRDNGRMALVRINDRGPYTQNRVIDLSKTAAKKLGMLNMGIAQVNLYPVSSHSLVNEHDSLALHNAYTIQLAKFKTGSKAFEYAQAIDSSRVEVVKGKNDFIYGVFYGLYQSRNSAFVQLRRLEKDNISGLVKQRRRLAREG